MSNTIKPVSHRTQVAKILRTHLKEQGIKGTVRAKKVGSSSSVDVSLTNGTPAQIALIASFALKYKYGRFNGMTDGYDVTNSREDIPQVGYLSVWGCHDDETKQRALDLLSERFNLPAMTLGKLPVTSMICGEPKSTYAAMQAVLSGNHHPHVPMWADDVEEACEYDYA